MNKNLLNLITSLKSEIDNLDDVKKLKILDEKINNDEEVLRLSYLKDMASLNYEDSLKHFNENSSEVRNAQKKLYEAKLALDSNELVKEYNAQYKIVKSIYDKINNEIFEPFK